MIVKEIWRHPVKSLQGERLDTADIEEGGLASDRRWGLRDPSTGRVLSAKREGRLLEATARLRDGEPEITLPDGEQLVGVGPAVDAALSAWLGRDVCLERADESRPASYDMHVDPEDDASPMITLQTPPGTFLDAGAVHLLTTASLAAMAGRHPDGRWHRRRFRPTLLVEVDGDGFVEDEWIGSSVQAGDVELAVFAPTVRCAMTTRAQPGLPADVGIARSVKRDHGMSLGVYAAVRRPGRVSVGDPVRSSSGLS